MTYKMKFEIDCDQCDTLLIYSLMFTNNSVILHIFIAGICFINPFFVLMRIIYTGKLPRNLFCILIF